MAVQPARRPDVQGGRSARPAQVRRRRWQPTLRIDSAPRRVAREVPHTVSPGPVDARLAAPPVRPASAWCRSRSSLAFIVMMILSGHGLDRAATGRRRSASTMRRRRSSAPTSRRARPPRPRRRGAGRGAREPNYQSTIVDPLADVIAELKAEKVPGGRCLRRPRDGRRVGRSARRRDGRHPRRQEKDERRRGRARRARATLPFGGDKWGRDVLKKTIKGSETSIFVGLAVGARSRRSSARCFGALAGYYGEWVDDFLNWFYSVFSSIPYLLLILAVAAVLQQKGIVHDHPDPRAHRLDRRVPADPRRVPEAQGARVRAGRPTRSARRTRAGCSSTSSPT